MIRRALRVLGWLLVGLVGTVGLFAASITLKALMGPSVMLPSGGVFVDIWDQGRVIASGTWIIEGGRQAFPLQTSNISCRRGEGCFSATAEIGGGLLSSNSYLMEITKWTPEVIVFTSTGAICVSYSYTISRADKRVIGVRTTKADAPADLCDVMEKGPLQLSLVDGGRVWRQLDAEAGSKVQPFFWGALAVMWAWVLIMLMRSIRAPGDPMPSRT